MVFKNEVFIKGSEHKRDSLSVDTIHEGHGHVVGAGIQVYSRDLYGDTTVVNLSVEEAERMIVEVRKILDNN